MKQGEIFGLLGANGAGKTTVIKMLTGILPPTGGEGRVARRRHADGQWCDQGTHRVHVPGLLLYLDLTVIENIRLFAGIYGLARRQAQQRMAWIVDMAASAAMNMIGQDASPWGAATFGIGLCTRPQPACPVS